MSDNLLLSEVRTTVGNLSDAERRRLLSVAFTCIDNTTLSGTDSPRSVEGFCRSAVSLSPVVDGRDLHVASVCLYPVFVPLAKPIIAPSPLSLAAVAGGFPAGQLPLSLKVNEVSYLVGEGADEVDFVINRGTLLDGGVSSVFDEVKAARKACGDKVHLKVILETGELPSSEAVYNASMQALQAGADFIKTSTGKSSVGATPEAALAMLSAIRDFGANSEICAGFKVSGGVSTPDDALFYLILTKKVLNIEKIDCHNFRIGTSRLTSALAQLLTE